MIVGVLAIALALSSCAGLQLKKPGAPELAALAESVGETIIVFLPVKYQPELIEWKPILQTMKADIEAGSLPEGKPLTIAWARAQFGGMIANALERVLALPGEEQLTPVQKQVLRNDFNRSLGLIQFEGEDQELTADQVTILFGAVNGVLQGMALIGI